MEYVARRHKKAFALVIVSIIISAIAGIAGSMFIQVIIDDYILEMLNTGENLFGGLAVLIVAMAAVYLVGVVFTWLYNRTMAVVA